MTRPGRPWPHTKMNRGGVLAEGREGNGRSIGEDDREAEDVAIELKRARYVADIDARGYAAKRYHGGFSLTVCRFATGSSGAILDSLTIVRAPLHQLAVTLIEVLVRRRPLHMIDGDDVHRSE